MLRYVRLVPLPRRLAFALGLFGLTIVLGAAGYMLLADMSVVDALYQSVTTVTTVGFREVKPFGTEEKLFTVGLIILGVGTALYTLTLVVQEGLEGDVRSRFHRRRRELEIDRLTDHYILCGFGRVGQEIARELSERQQPFVVIEERPESADLARAYDYHVILGDAAQERILLRAGLDRARCLLAASDSDAGNTYITLTARNLAPDIFIIARVAYPHNDQKLRLAGADRVLSLYSLGGRRMVLLALQPLAADFMDTLAAGRQGDLVLAEFEVTKESGLAGIEVKQLLAGTNNSTILGIRRGDGSLAVGPHENEQLGEGDILIILAEESDLALMRSGRW